MDAIDTRYPQPNIRVSLHYDTDCLNPLTDWEHGVEFAQLPNASRTMRDYTDIDTFSNTYRPGTPLALPDFGNCREWYDDSWREPWQNAHTAPSLYTFLNKHCAAWGIVDRGGYDGTLRFIPSTDTTRDDLTDADGIAYVGRENFLTGWHGKPATARLTASLRASAMDGIRSVINEYNAWATGDCYGYTVERHNPACPYCEDPSGPDTDCVCWDDTDDACWGFIGHDYAMQTLAEIAENYAKEDAA